MMMGMLGVESGNHDPYFSFTKLLLGFEGTNGSTGSPGMTDQSSSARGTGTVTGTAAIDTSQFKFGASSLKPGTGGLTFPDSIDWQLSAANSDQFTVECAVRFNTIAINKLFVAQYAAAGTFSWGFQTGGSVASEFQFASSSDGSTFNNAIVSSGAGLTTGVWYQLAADKDATGKIRIYKDGVMAASSTPANSAMFNSTTILSIGESGGGTGVLDGWVDELRITKGIARYASDSGYTVATAAFPRS
jgi:hypothetical protein